jgi:hypothetical protein
MRDSPIRKTEAMMRRINTVAVGERYSNTIFTPINDNPQKIMEMSRAG